MQGTRPKINIRGPCSSGLGWHFIDNRYNSVNHYVAVLCDWLPGAPNPNRTQGTEMPRVRKSAN